MTAQAQQLVHGQLPYLRAMAARIQRKLPPHVELDELVSLGAEGLCQAARRFKAAQGAGFRTFAHYRMQGAIYDGVRRMASGPISAPNDLLDALHPIDDSLEDSYEQARRAAALRQALAELAPEERRVLTLHYFQDMTLADAARAMGCSKSWASRLHDRALEKLRSALVTADY